MLLYFCITSALMATLLLYIINKEGSLENTVKYFNERYANDKDFIPVTNKEFILLCIIITLFGWCAIPALILVALYNMVKK